MVFAYVMGSYRQLEEDSPPAFSCFLRAVASWFQRAPQELGIEARDPSNSAINNAIGYSHNQSHILQIEPVRSQNPESHPARSIQRRKRYLLPNQYRAIYTFGAHPCDP